MTALNPDLESLAERWMLSCEDGEVDVRIMAVAGDGNGFEFAAFRRGIYIEDVNDIAYALAAEIAGTLGLTANGKRIS